MNKNLLLLCCAFLYQYGFSQQFPATKKTPKIIEKHDTLFTDDYPWLEEAASEETNIWVEQQNAFTESHYQQVRKKFPIRSKIEDYDFLSTNSMPYKNGKYYYTLSTYDRTKPYSLFIREDLNDDPLEIISPYRIYKSTNVVLSNYRPSKSSRYVAAKLTLDGSDRQEIRFSDVAKNEILEDVIKDVKFSNMAWHDDNGIFYKKNSNKKIFERDSTLQLYYHKIGTAQEKDQLVYDATATHADFSFFCKENKLFLIESDKEETRRSLYVADLSDTEIELKMLIANDPALNDFVYYKKGRIYFSDTKYAWGEIRSFNIYDRKDEKVVVPQLYNHLLLDTEFYDGYIIAKYKTQGRNYMIVYDESGKFIRKFDVPHSMDFMIRYFDAKTKDLYVTFYSYTISYLNYKLNLDTGKTGIYLNEFIESKPSLFTFDHFETKTITYKSRDHEDVPITIVHKKGLKLDGNNPTLLKAYGGFGVVSGPDYDTGLLYFLEKGGVFAYAEIRGGGDKGSNWHRDGMGLKKINTFNDFIDAAEFLIRERYTSPKKMAITGGSQGGLLVGVAMTQRPELFKVAIPEVGVFDMAKFGDYTVGRFHKDEYGDPENETEFNAMMQYSPFHNVKEEVNYPITLIITSENDDRVPPIHSYKFAAKLQGRAAQKNPIYLKTLKDAGHYGKNSNYKEASQERADFYGFLLYHLQ